MLPQSYPTFWNFQIPLSAIYALKITLSVRDCMLGWNPPLTANRQKPVQNILDGLFVFSQLNGSDTGNNMPKFDKTNLKNICRKS